MMTSLSTRQLVELHIHTLFCCDAEGRLCAVNEAGEPPAPLFYMGRTLYGNCWCFRFDLPSAIVESLNRLCHTEPVATELASPPRNYEAIKAVLGAVRSLQEQKEYRGPAYRIPEGTGEATSAVLISVANAELLQPHFAWMLPLMQERNVGPIAAAIEQGRAVSLCFCSRRPGHATEAGLETVAAFRGKGYATAAVAAWAAAVRRLGCIPLYSTSWDNLASQAVARKLGMEMYGEDWSIQ